MPLALPDPIEPTPTGLNGVSGDNSLDALRDLYFQPIQDAINSIGTGGDTDLITVTQAAHGFAFGDWLQSDGVSGYELAVSHALGIVAEVVDVNTFKLQTGGLVTGLSGMAHGTTQYLDTGVPGAHTETEPTVGETRVVLGVALNTTSMFINIEAPETVVDATDRAGHTGTQLADTIADFTTAVQANVLNDMALPDAELNLNGQKIVSLANGAASTDAATVGQLPTRGTVVVTSPSLANDATDATQNAAIGKRGDFLSITTDRAAWVRFYRNAADRTADAARLISVDPAANAGVLLEIITTGAETRLCDQPEPFANMESPETSVIPMAITNKSGATATVQVTINRQLIEA